MDTGVRALNPCWQHAQHIVYTRECTCTEKARLHVLHGVFDAAFGFGISLGTYPKAHILLVKKGLECGCLEDLSVNFITHKHAVLIDYKRFYTAGALTGKAVDSTAGLN